MAFKSHFFEKAKWETKRGALYVSLKEGIVSTVGASGSSGMLKAAMGWLTGSANGSLTALLGLGAVGGLSAGLVYMDYRKNLDLLAQDYAEEIGAKLRKDPKKVDAEDVLTVAYGDPNRGIEPNVALRDAIGQERKAMGFGIVFSIIASIGAMALAPVLLGAVGLAALHGGALAFLAHGLAGLVCYNAIKIPLHMVGDKIFGLDEDTPIDRIEKIGKMVEKGQAISREQILSVYVASNPDLSAYIKNRFGAEFDELDAEGQSRAATMMQRYLPLDAVAEAVTTKRICATELAFTVQGDVSGVALDTWQAPPKSLIEKMIGKASGVFSHENPELPQGDVPHNQQLPNHQHPHSHHRY